MIVHFKQPVYEALDEAIQLARKERVEIEFIQLDLEESQLYWKESAPYRHHFVAPRRYYKGTRIVLDGESYDG